MVKCPLTWDGLKATRIFREEGTKVNVTLCFSASQALLAAKAGASYISPFIGRLDDVSENGMQLIHNIVQIYEVSEQKIYHFDLYRLESADELLEIGFEDALEDGICLIEWPQIAQNTLKKSSNWMHP